MTLKYDSCPHCNSKDTACANCGKTVCLCYHGNNFCFTCDTFFSKTPNSPTCYCSDRNNENKVVCNHCGVWRSTGQSNWRWINKSIPYCECERTKDNELKCWNCGVVRQHVNAPWQFSDRDYEYSYSCNHLNSEVRFAEGNIIVRASSCYRRDIEEETPPDFGLYMDGMWTPIGPAYLLGWQDFGLPYNWTLAAELILDIYLKASVGKWVEVGCIGGHGRTGTVLACMGVLSGLDAKTAIKYVRETYCSKAIETKEQEWWVKWFEAYMFGGTTPGRPKPYKKSGRHIPEIYDYETGWITTQENPHLERRTEFDDEAITWASRKVVLKPNTKKKAKKK